MTAPGFHLRCRVDLPPDVRELACQGLDLQHDDHGVPLWLTDRCEPGLLRAGLAAESAGLVEIVAPLADKFRALRQSCPADGLFLLMTTRTVHDFDLAAPLSVAWRSRYDFADDQAMDMELALQEALANAVLHGNLGLDSSWRAKANLRDFAILQRERLDNPEYGLRMVAVASYRQGDCLQVIVTNEGPGFDWLRAAAPQKLQSDCARGLSLIHRLSLETEFSDNGCQISMLLPIR